MLIYKKYVSHKLAQQLITIILCISTCNLPAAAQNSDSNSAHTVRKLLLAHYMPWYSAKPFSPFWGWHWTMGHFQPDVETDGRKQAASHYYPLIGLYDSADTDALDCQCLLMKISGIDGVIIDWYGTDDHLDYAINHRNTLSMIKSVKKCGLKYAICYEDSIVPGLISAGKFKETDAIDHARDMMKWVNGHWFQDEAYVKIGKRPVFLVFGNGYYQGDQWDKIFDGLNSKPILFTEAHQRAGSAGAFDWPHPEGGDSGATREMDLFYTQCGAWEQCLPVAYPRFHDIYAQAGVHKSWGELADNSGRTFETTLERALRSSAKIIQIATWNDWGEGTQIEPSVEYGYRDLEAVQRRATHDRNLPYSPADLRLPIKLLKLERQDRTSARQALDRAEQALIEGNVDTAKKLLDGVAGAK